MMRVFQLVVLIFMSTCARKFGKIYGGYQVKHNEFPHQAGVAIRLLSDCEIFCGGSVLSKYFVLTAAHCEEKFSSLFSIYLLVGTNEIRNELKNIGTWYKVSHFYYHPKWSPTTMDYDLLLMKSSEVIRLIPGFVEVIKLPGKQTHIPKVNNKVWTSGWGLEAPDKPPSNLRKIELNIISEQKCSETWGKARQKRYCTVNDQDGWGTCDGDSGSGLIYNQRLIGVLSYGTAECDLNEPDVYIDIHVHLDWINETLNLHK